MKSLYIIPFLLLSVTFYAQEKKAAELQDQEQVLKDAKAFKQKMQKQNEANSTKKEKQTVLASEQGLEAKQETQQMQNENNPGKLLPNTASFEEVLATIPNRKVAGKTMSSKSAIVQGLPNTATLEEIKKTIPKN
ncbi:hypothetical protein K0U91_05985 [Chryseobacterium chendengshani]|uniref:hypothetical protein n=1 Tax=Chryseobacterium sp. LJ668 TaxID=2864040 RepID=UPI001C68CE07|nr:hypothetical protein [Chryseobacterium sp. LJ668]MBW8522020.1 hypothetical protein [Chryseobacterium sp. LJ668]QYK17673.1 hypothetical protein K0U91_05985 [Chryseobacterium sp. LJ668]